MIGFDLISFVEDDDKLIIIDAIKSDSEIGEVNVLGEDDLSKDLSVVSQHDFGIEQSATASSTSTSTNKDLTGLRRNTN